MANSNLKRPENITDNFYLALETPKLTEFAVA